MAGEENIIDKIQKLLNLAAKNPNEAEAASAASKAQELLEKYNLSTAALESHADAASGKRQEELVDGGFYRYQRDIWSSVAEQNFCFHWIQQVYVPPDQRVRGTKYKRRHRLVGRVANVKSTIVMANYLLNAIERVTRDVCEEKHIDNRVGAWAMSFREGCAYRLTTRLWERRREREAEAEKAEQEAWERAAKAGVSLSTTLTIASHSRNEADLNTDFIQGLEPGTTAKRRAERASKARENEEAYTRWAQANPEEARRKVEEDEKARKAIRGRGGRSRSVRGRYDKISDPQGFWEGDKRGNDIGLDPQAEDRATKSRRISHG